MEIQQLFSNILSTAIEHAQATQLLDCPFWSRGEATIFGEALKELGGVACCRFPKETYQGGEIVRRLYQKIGDIINSGC